MTHNVVGCPFSIGASWLALPAGSASTNRRRLLRRRFAIQFRTSKWGWTMNKKRLALGLLAIALGTASVAVAFAPSGISTWSPQERNVIDAWPARRPSRQLDAQTEARIAHILAGMTLEQKIGQMTQPEIRYIHPDDVRRYAIGSILNGGGSWPGMNMHASVAEWTALADAFSKAALASGAHDPIPLLWGVDAVHGHNNLPAATIYPHNIGLGAAHDPDLIYRIGRATGRAVRATGINWAFAPTIAVVRNQRWGRAYESFSSDPAQVARDGAALIRGLQGDLTSDGDVLATAKHFVGDGGTDQGIDQGVNMTSPHDLATVDGAGYRTALDAGVQTVMVSYNSWSSGGTTPYGKMHGNRALITGVLKQRLSFDGLVISDWNAIEQVPGCTVDHCPAAINAGIDIVMVPEKWQSFIANTVEDVRAGRISISRIDDAVTRILRVKFRMGLFARPTSSGRYTGDESALVDRPLAQEAVRASAVLLKDDRAALPLRAGGRVLVVGDAANSFAQQSGGWSITWQGDQTTNADFRTGETLLAGLRRVYGADRVDYSADGAAFAKGKYVAIIAVIGEEPHAETKGDVRYPAPLAQSARFPEQRALLDKLFGQGTPVVTVLYSGRTLYVTDLMNRSDAFVAAFLPGSEAGTLADLFAGGKGRDFRGRLSFAWPKTPCPSGGEPMGETLFARGFGLSYAKPRTTGHLNEVAIPAQCK